MVKKEIETEISPIDIDADLLFAEWDPAHQVANSLHSPPEIETIAANSPFVFDIDYFYCLIFILSGKGEFSAFEDEALCVEENQMLLLPMGKLFKFTARDCPVTFLTIKFRPSINLCMGSCPRSLETGNRQYTRSARKKSEDKITSLYLNEGIDLWLKQMLYYIERNPNAMPVFEIKLRELFYILRISIPVKKRDEFLASYHCHNLGFRAFVFRHHLDCRTVEELATMMKFSISTVKRLFLEEFGVSPLKWMHEQKARFIYRDLADGDLTLQQIADRYYFSSISYLCVFCRKIFGTTPLKIRQKLNIEETD